MGVQAIVDKIISDAEEAAKKIIADAEKRAKDTCDEANNRAERARIGTEAEVKEKIKSLTDGKEAAARLDCAKILLAEKRSVIDGVYSRALQRLIELGKGETLKLSEYLLNEYAEEGDEIVFSKSFKYAEDVSKLNVVKDKKLKISFKPCQALGGFVLKGKTADKDISYDALLAADREEHQSSIAAKIF